MQKVNRERSLEKSTRRAGKVWTGMDCLKTLFRRRHFQVSNFDEVSKCAWRNWRKKALIVEQSL